MRTMLSFQLPAKLGASIENVIRSMWNWVARSPHYDLKSPLPGGPLDQGFTCCSEDFYGRTAAFQLVQYIEKNRHYIAAQLEKPDEENNLLWQAQCIFEQQEGTAGIYFILLNRGVLNPEKAADLTVVPTVPFIAKRLFLDKLVPKPNGIDGGQRDHYPQIRFGAQASLRDDLNKILPFVSRIANENELNEENGVRVIYPQAGIDYIYSEEQCRQDAEGAKAQIVSDVFSMISEVHGGPKLSFEVLWYLASRGGADTGPSVSLSGSYCYMNQAMASLLKQARRESGLSQKELAQRVGSSGLILSRLETMRVQRVLRSMLNDIERELNLPKDAIVSLQGNGTQPTTVDAKNDGIFLTPAPTPTEGNLPQKAGYCRQCGTHLYADSRFCPVCGTKILPV